MSPCLTALKRYLRRIAEALQPGQVWRFPDARVVRLAEVSGDDVNGIEQLTGRGRGSGAPPAGHAVWAGGRSDFADAELVGPLFRVSFLFSAAGPQDPIAAALEEVGSVEHRVGARIETGSGEERQRLNLSEVEWTVDVVALSAEAAEDRVIGALKAFGSIKRGSMVATEIPLAT